MSFPPPSLKRLLAGALLASAALAAVASAQDECNGCDPPDYIEDIDVTCPVCEDVDTPTAFTYADPDHCSEYYECYQGCATHQICEGDFLYDAANGWCNTPEDVRCGDRDCDGRPCSTAPTDAPAVGFNCTSDGTFPDPENCIKYIQCSNGDGVEKICPVADDGQQELWCEECGDMGWCDFPENVNCGSRPICDANDENCEMQPTVAPQPCDVIPCGDDTEFIDLGPCEECYCECVSGTPYTYCCADGLFYNPANGLCDWDYNNPGCSKK